MKEIVLLYGLDPKKQSETVKILRIAGVAVRIVENRELCQSIAYLANILGALSSPKEYEGAPKRECMILCGLTSKSFHTVTDKMRRHKIAIDLRGIMTQTNMSWSLERTIDELADEKTYITAWNQLDRLVKKEKQTPEWIQAVLNQKDADLEKINEAIARLSETQSAD